MPARQRYRRPCYIEEVPSHPRRQHIDPAVPVNVGNGNAVGEKVLVARRTETRSRTKHSGGQRHLAKKLGECDVRAVFFEFERVEKPTSLRLQGRLDPRFGLHRLTFNKVRLLNLETHVLNRGKIAQVMAPLPNKSLPVQLVTGPIRVPSDSRFVCRMGDIATHWQSSGTEPGRKIRSQLVDLFFAHRQRQRVQLIGQRLRIILRAVDKSPVDGLAE